MQSAMPQEKGPVREVARLRNLSSMEYFLCKEREHCRVLRDINLLVSVAQTWGITGRSIFEIRLLLEIIAGIKPYDGGKCVLAGRGMLKRKRTILPHVFYIGNSDMLYGNMNVLEYLMFAMDRKRTVSRVELQEQLLEFVVAAGMGHIMLTPVKELSKEEKAVVTLMAAVHSGSLLTVLNLPEYEFDPTLTKAIGFLSDIIQKGGRSLIMGTEDCYLIEKACSHTACITGGELLYSGTVENLRHTYDPVEVILTDKNIDYMLERLTPLLPGFRLTVRDGCLLIGGGSLRDGGSGYIYRKLAEAGVLPEHVQINPKTVCNAYEELFLQYDLQNKLL